MCIRCRRCPLPNLSQSPQRRGSAHGKCRGGSVRPARSGGQAELSGYGDLAPAVAEICARLDGLPLAIELAAARIQLMPPRAMLARLGDRLDFLTGGTRDSPPRQQTLRNAIAWSYDLLSETEQKLFQRLSVFVGGCTLEAAEAVAGDDLAGSSVLDQLGSLLDKSLMRQAESINDEPRFVILELLREFGWEALQSSGEHDTVQQPACPVFPGARPASRSQPGGRGTDPVDGPYGARARQLAGGAQWSKTAAGT